MLESKRIYKIQTLHYQTILRWLHLGCAHLIKLPEGNETSPEAAVYLIPCIKQLQLQTPWLWNIRTLKRITRNPLGVQIKKSLLRLACASQRRAPKICPCMQYLFRHLIQQYVSHGMVLKVRGLDSIGCKKKRKATERLFNFWFLESGQTHTSVADFMNLCFATRKGKNSNLLKEKRHWKAYNIPGDWFGLTVLL